MRIPRVGPAEPRNNRIGSMPLSLAGSAVSSGLASVPGVAVSLSRSVSPVCSSAPCSAAADWGDSRGGCLQSGVRGYASASQCQCREDAIVLPVGTSKPDRPRKRRRKRVPFEPQAAQADQARRATAVSNVVQGVLDKNRQ